MGKDFLEARFCLACDNIHVQFTNETAITSRLIRILSCPVFGGNHFLPDIRVQDSRGGKLSQPYLGQKIFKFQATLDSVPKNAAILRWHPGTYVITRLSTDSQSKKREER